MVSPVISGAMQSPRPQSLRNVRWKTAGKQEVIIPVFMWKVREYAFSSRASRHLTSLPGKQRSACDTLSSPNSDQSLITNRGKEIWATPRYLPASLPNQKKLNRLFQCQMSKRTDTQLPLSWLLGLHHAHLSKQYRSSKAEYGVWL